MTKNKYPRYTNKSCWDGGTMNSAALTLTLPTTSAIFTDDVKVDFIKIIAVTAATTTVVNIAFKNSAAATYATFKVEVPVAATTTATDTYVDVLDELGLPSDAAGNPMLTLPYQHTMTFTCGPTALENKQLDVLTQFSSYVSD